MGLALSIFFLANAKRSSKEPRITRKKFKYDVDRGKDKILVVHKIRSRVAQLLIVYVESLPKSIHCSDAIKASMIKWAAV